MLQKEFVQSYLMATQPLGLNCIVFLLLWKGIQCFCTLASGSNVWFCLLWCWSPAAQVAERDQELADLRQNLAADQERLKQAHQELERSQQEASQRHSVLIAEVKERDQLIESLQAENVKLQQEISKLKKDLLAEQAESAGLKHDLETSQQATESLDQQLGKQKSQVDGLLERLNTQISDLHANVAEVESKYRSACAETDSIRNEVCECPCILSISPFFLMAMVEFSGESRLLIEFLPVV